MRSPRLPRPTQAQIQLADKLGLNVRGLSQGVAIAKILELVEAALHGRVDNRMATDKQIAFGKQLGLDLDGETLTIASVRIGEVLEAQNLRAIRRMRLKPGDKVRRADPFTLSDGREMYDAREFVVSSIYPDGSVYFKGGNGQRAWARNLEKIGSAST